MRIAYFFLLSLLLVFLTTCEGKGKAGGAASATRMHPNGQVIDTVQELNYPMNADPSTLDASRATDAYAADMLALISAPLLKVQRYYQDEAETVYEDKIALEGAESYQVSSDGLVWTFKLREMMWQDGKPITAEAYRYGVERLLSPATASSYVFILEPIKNAMKFNRGEVAADQLGIAALDAKTLQITLERKTPFFTEILYRREVTPLRKDWIEAQGGAYGSEANTLLSSGPYILSEWVHENKLVFVPNPKYWDRENIMLDRITFHVIKEENTRMNMLETGAIDSAGVSKPEWIELFNKDSELKFRRKPIPGTNYVVLNHRNKYLKNKNIRLALSLAMDRDEANQVMFNNIFEPAYGFVPHGITMEGESFRTKVGEQPLRAKLGQDPKELFRKGLQELGLNEKPEQITLTYLSISSSTWSRQYVELNQQQLKRNLGITMAVDTVEWGVFLQRLNDGNYDFGGMAWSADYNDPINFLELWTTGTGENRANFSNAEYDQLIAASRETNDPAERFRLFKQAEKILVADEAAIIPTLFRFSNGFTRRYVKMDYQTNAFASSNYKGIYLQGKNKKP